MIQPLIFKHLLHQLLCDKSDAFFRPVFAIASRSKIFFFFLVFFVSFFFHIRFQDNNLFLLLVQIDVELEDFKQAQPDAIAHSAAKIISRLKDGGEKTTQALKSLCWRCKGLQVEVKKQENKGYEINCVCESLLSGY